MILKQLLHIMFLGIGETPLRVQDPPSPRVQETPLGSGKPPRVFEAAAYDAERFILQETFLELKICGLYTRAASNQERVIMAHVRYATSCLV